MEKENFFNSAFISLSYEPLDINWNKISNRKNYKKSEIARIYCYKNVYFGIFNISGEIFQFGSTFKDLYDQINKLFIDNTDNDIYLHFVHSTNTPKKKLDKLHNLLNCDNNDNIDLLKNYLLLLL